MEDELIPEFIEESKAFLSSIESDLLSLECNLSLDIECVNRVFRAIHTVKGSGAILKLDQIVAVSHRAESLLCKIRDGKTLPSSDNIGVILDAVDTLVGMLDSADLGQTADCQGLLQRLDGFIGASLEAPKGSSEPIAKGKIAKDVPAQPARKVPVSKSEQTGTTNAVTTSADASSAISPKVAKTSPTPPPPSPTSTPQAAQPQPAAAQSTTRVSDPTMRVPSSVLNHLLQITGGMVMARNQLLNSSDSLDNPSLERLSRLISEVHETVITTRKSTTGVLFNKFQRIVRDLALSLGKEVELVIEGGELELDRGIIDSFSDPLTHLVRNCIDHAIETPEQRLAVGKPRAGTVWLRSSQQSGEIVLEVEDNGRGIDPVVIRRKAAEKGLMSSQQANALSDDEAVMLIFTPGFSTKDQATDVSGRGVGMDVVKTNIEQIGGGIVFESRCGKGTKLTAHLPLAKALVASSLTRTLIVGIGDSQFAIPDTAICEIIRPDKSNYPRDFRALEHGEVFHLRESILPLIHLADAIGKPRMLFSDSKKEYIPDPYPTIGPSTLQASSNQNIRGSLPNIAVVVIRHRQHRFALVVNEVIGIREAIVQPVPKLIEHCWMYIGHAIMGDGRCIFILDIGNIAKRNRLQLDNTSKHPSSSARDRKISTAERVLVFNYAPDEYFAIPLEIASLVQAVQVDQLRRVGNTSYYPCQEKMVTLLYLDQYLRVKPLKNSNTPSTIILPANFEIDVAIACGDDIRVHELNGCFRSKSESDTCSVGLFELEGRLVTLLDLYRLVEMHAPDQLTLSTALPVRSARILCAEDSAFFQRLLHQYLNRPEWDIQVVGNGREAFDVLHRSSEPFDLLIADINMPEMNGFELAERVRADARFNKMPMLALTTQVDDQSRSRGFEVGFCKYVGKINKFALRKCVEDVLMAGENA